ncbi:hypothetical protein Tco_1181201, partial [Tanacetum coccineum]
TVTQKDHDISLLNSRAACLASTLDDAKVACAEAEDKITSLASKRDMLSFEDFKERMEIQQEEQAQELFNRVAELEAYEGLEAGYEHRTAGRNLFVVDAYNPEAAKASYINAVKAFEDVDFPLVNLLKSKKDAGIDEVLDCFLLDGPLAESRAEHELELKEKLRAKYTARGRLLEEKDLENLKLKSQLAEKEVEAAEVIRLRDQVSSLSGEKSALTAEVSALKVTITQKDHDISLLNSHATCLASTLDDAKVACAEAGNKITSLASERNRLASEDFKERMEIQQEE